MRILVGYPRFPEADRSSGGLRQWEMVRLLVEAGHDVTFLARRENDAKYRQDLEKLNVVCVADGQEVNSGSPGSMCRLLSGPPFDVAILSHFKVYETYAPFLRAFVPDCRCVLDTVDLHFVRLARAAALKQENTTDRFAAEETRRREWAAIRDADSVWVVTNTESDMLIEHRLVSPENIDVVGNIHRVASETPDFHARSGIAFLGAYGHSPNVDAAHYLMREIVPLLSESLADVPLTLAGSSPTPDVLQYQSEHANVTVPGFVEDHRELLAAHRVGLAPLRYGAGMKGKVGEYFCCGLPCVTSSIGAEGMGLEDSRHILLADNPASFADAIAKLYQDEELWTRLQKNGLDYAKDYLSHEALRPVLLSAVDKSAGATLQRSKSDRFRQSLSRAVDLRRWWRISRSSLESLSVGGVNELRQNIQVWRYRP